VSGFRGPTAVLRSRSTPWGPVFHVFDLLWLTGEDLRKRPLIERKRLLRSLVPEQSTALLYVNHIEQHRVELFRLACDLDLPQPQAHWTWMTLRRAFMPSNVRIIPDTPGSSGFTKMTSGTRLNSFVNERACWQFNAGTVLRPTCASSWPSYKARPRSSLTTRAVCPRRSSGKCSMNFGPLRMIDTLFESACVLPRESTRCMSKLRLLLGRLKGNVYPSIRPTRLSATPPNCA
jgi:hypothetical protein